MRRLPVYLLVECSGSMAGDPLDHLSAGLHSLVAQLQSDPEAIELVWLSLIVYGSSASVILPLCEMGNVNFPALSAGGVSSLGDGLRLLLSEITKNQSQSSASSKGDWAPLILVITQGSPTDEWKTAAAELRASLGSALVIGCLFGSQADFDVLASFSDKIVQVPSTPEATRVLAKWLFASIKAVLGRASGNTSIQLPAITTSDGIRDIPVQRRIARPVEAPTGQSSSRPSVRCLVIMPFRKDFDEVFLAVQKAAGELDLTVNLDCYWLKDVLAAGKITDDIVDGLKQSALCIADVTDNNPNVMWEAGYSMALGKPTILIGQNVVDLPFDLKIHRVLSYRRDDLDSLTRDLQRALHQTVERYGIRASATQNSLHEQQPLVIAVTGSMSANAAKSKRRIESMLAPYAGKQALWYCGSNGIIDQTVIDFLVSRKERVIAVGYHAYDVGNEIRRFIEDDTIQFMNASVESVPRNFMDLSERDTIFLTKADLMVIFWDGESRGTKALLDCCQEAGKNLLLSFI